LKWKNYLLIKKFQESMNDVSTSRWPPTYDFDSLSDQIKELVSSQALFKEFYLRQDSDVPCVKETSFV